MRRSVLWAIVAVCLCWCALPGIAADEEKKPAVLVMPTAADKELGARALELGKKAQGTMGQESANFLLNDWPSGLVKVLMSDEKVPEDQLGFARGCIKNFADTLAKVPGWPTPPSVRVPYTKSMPVIDGKLNDAAWQHALVLQGVCVLNEKKRAAGPATTWRLMWDEKYLYLGVSCADTKIIAPRVGHNGPIYDNDCVELFLLPDFAKGVYWELEVSAIGDLFELQYTKKFDHWGSNPNQGVLMQGLLYAAALHGTANKSDDTDSGYGVEMAVPFASLPGAAATAKGTAGQTLRFMLARMDRTPTSFTPYAFCPLLSWTHNIWNYATMTLKK